MAGTKAARQAELNDILQDERFHRRFTIPADAAAGRPEEMTVSYSDFGYRNEADPSDENVLLFCGPLLCTRLMHVAKDDMAKRYKVRIIFPDRPGFGETTEVPVADRVKTWLTIVPALLSHLSITHVSLACHSGGTIYAMNTLLHLRHILHPAHPYIAICTPWIDTTHTDSIAMHSVQKLVPDAVLSRLDLIAGFLTPRVVPTLGFSGNVISAAARLIPGTGTSAKEKKAALLAPGVDAEEADWCDEMLPVVIARVYKDKKQVKGLGDEAMLLMRRSKRMDGWGVWEDYEKLVPMLAEREVLGNWSGASGTGKLRVDVFFAEEDIMIGNSKGPKWWEGCWAEHRRGSSIEYRSEFVENTDHDFILETRFGVFERIFKAVSGQSGGVGA